MPAPGLRLAEGIDRRWLDAAAEADPLTHAFAAFDVLHAPDRIRFVSLLDGDSTLAYLLLWYGLSGIPVVHWVGTPDRWAHLLPGLPSRPFAAVVPPEVAGSIRERAAPAAVYPLWVMAHPSLTPAVEGPERGTVRRLGRGDAAALARLSDEDPALITSVYRSVDPQREPVWGAFDGPELVAVARATITLPALWIIGGIYTRPAARRQGWGRAVTAAATREAGEAGARPALVVRTDNDSAIRMYHELGYETVARRVWIDAGTGLVP